MARRIVNRMEKRAEYEAYEATQRGKQGEDEDEKDDDEDQDEEAEASEDEAEEAEEEEEAAPVKKKAPAKRAKRTHKVPRMKVVWGVFSNSNQRVATYDYPQKQQAEEHAARLRAEKRSTFFVQPVKEPMEEKKDEA